VRVFGVGDLGGSVTPTCGSHDVNGWRSTNLDDLLCGLVSGPHGPAGGGSFARVEHGKGRARPPPANLNPGWQLALEQAEADRRGIRRWLLPVRGPQSSHPLRPRLLAASPAPPVARPPLGSVPPVPVLGPPSPPPPLFVASSRTDAPLLATPPCEHISRY
jgi:hypothetical protein